MTEARIPPENKEAVLAFLQKNPASPFTAIQTGTGLGRVAVRKVLMAFEVAGKIRATYDSRTDRQYYSLAKQEESA